MKPYLAFFSIPARLRPHDAKLLSATLLKETAPDVVQTAMAVAFLYQSWVYGRMHLGAHWKHLRRCISDPSGLVQMTSGELVVDHTMTLRDVMLHRQAAHRMQTWLHEILEAGLTHEAAFREALLCLGEQLPLQPEEPASLKLNASLAELFPSESQGEEEPVTQAPGSEFRQKPSSGGPAPVRAFLIGPGGPVPSSPGQAALLQAFMRGIGSMEPQSAPAALSISAPVEEIQGPKVKVWSKEDAAALLARSNGGPGESNGKQLGLLQSMASADGWKPLAELPQDKTPSAVLAELYQRFPHFKQVLDFVNKALALSGCGAAGKPVHIPPILLRGSPGTGKTYFAQELARVLGLYFVERDLSVTTEAFVINGNDATWKGSKPGIVLDSLLHGQSANPLILLNEVDKAIERGSHNSPIAPMYGLLEPTSASRFIDEFVPLPIDASHVNWILTANDGFIPAPILTRLEVFDIKDPDEAQCRAIAASVWTALLQRTLPAGHGFVDELPEEILVRLSKVSPRVMRKALTAAAGEAVLQGRRSLVSTDLESDGGRYLPAQRTGMGFIA